MRIPEMHVWFRQYAQQMGMQNTRAILPEQIDLVINTSITDTVNQIFAQNIGMTNDRIITDNSKIGQINALRGLYKVKVVNANLHREHPLVPPTQPFRAGEESNILRIYSNISNFSDSNDIYYIVESVIHSGQSVISINNSTKEVYDANSNKVNVTDWEDIYTYEDSEYTGYSIKYSATELPFDYLYLVDLSINYKNSNNKVTNYFPVRLIDDTYLADTLNDFILKPRLRTPIAVVYNNQLDLYIDDIDSNGNLPQNLETNELRVSYIGKPAKVQYKSDIGGSDIDCDLPEYMHVDILKHAVDLYRVSVSGNLYGNQQQTQTQGANTPAPSDNGNY